MKVLVIVDYQNDFCENGNLPVKGGDSLYNYISKKIPEYDKILITLDSHIDYENHIESESFPSHCLLGSDGWKLHKLNILDNLYERIKETDTIYKFNNKLTVITKNNIDVSTVPEFKSFMENEYGYDSEFIIMGLAYDYCVKAAAKAISKLGYKHVYIDENGTKAISELNNEFYYDLAKNNIQIKNYRYKDTMEYEFNLYVRKKYQETFKINFDKHIEKVKQFLSKKNYKTMIVGLSGGIDSSVTAKLVHDYTDKKVIGVSIMMGNSDEEKKRADFCGEHYVDDYIVIDEKEMLNIYNQFRRLLTVKDIQNHPITKLREGNIKARLRMIILYDLARKHSGLVLSTDNQSEYKIGFWTINGDVGDIGPIQSLYKTEVYNLARKINVAKEIIDAKPTDGLGVTKNNTDEAQIGLSYFDLDCALKYLDDKKNDMKEFSVPPIKLLRVKALKENSEFKRIGYISL